MDTAGLKKQNAETSGALVRLNLPEGREPEEEDNSTKLEQRASEALIADASSFS